jgi:hypothetical protein
LTCFVVLQEHNIEGFLHLGVDTQNFQTGQFPYWPEYSTIGDFAAPSPPPPPPPPFPVQEVVDLTDMPLPLAPPPLSPPPPPPLFSYGLPPPQVSLPPISPPPNVHHPIGRRWFNFNAAISFLRGDSPPLSECECTDHDEIFPNFFD